jgi:hypothetical protein
MKILNYIRIYIIRTIVLLCPIFPFELYLLLIRIWYLFSDYANFGGNFLDNIQNYYDKWEEKFAEIVNKILDKFDATSDSLDDY